MDDLGQLTAGILYFFIFISVKIVQVGVYLITNPYVMIPFFIIIILGFIFPEDEYKK